MRAITLQDELSKAVEVKRRVVHSREGAWRCGLSSMKSCIRCSLLGRDMMRRCMRRVGSIYEEAKALRQEITSIVHVKNATHMNFALLLQLLFATASSFVIPASRSRTRSSILVLIVG
jgi:hypothetical protein